MDKLREILKQLTSDGDRRAVLDEVKPALSSLSRKDSEDGLKDIDLAPLFDCLHSSDLALVETASDVLQYLLTLQDQAPVIDT